VCATLQGLHLVDAASGSKRDLAVQGLFYGIGHQPNNKLVAGQVELDEAGYVKVCFGGGGQTRLCWGAQGLQDSSPRNRYLQSASAHS
jgi:thioredoxin reductase (NADPH)